MGVRAATPMVQVPMVQVLGDPTGVVLHNLPRGSVGASSRLVLAVLGPMAAAPALAKVEVQAVLVRVMRILTKTQQLIVVVVVLVMLGAAVVLPLFAMGALVQAVVAVARLGQATVLPTSPIQQLQALPMALSPSLITSN